ncbi:hypothetical protein [Actinomadura verrucosospora]|uniref:Uncharacterized protein n=1 Tax=Actinomadura verrucosospora TaxID=46165 RepID=A0A7D3ZPA0_ACTVE|nr:hypothetical protein [Actinomadura verrucosospora]QKG23202.1 hypothetical protein ACTIVE_4843 [Actinomadura verrucosospora]
MPDVNDAGDPRGFASADHLDALARALADAGWSSAPRYDRVPALMHVYARDMPGFGESVRVTAGADGTPWFLSSTGDLLAPCHDSAGATTKIAAILAPLLAVVRPQSNS